MSKNYFEINKRKIGLDHPPYCIAEVGINHNGSVDIAKKMINIAKQAGADAVKFQTFKAEEFCGDPHQVFTYKSEGKDHKDLVRGPRVNIFDLYFDKFGKGSIQKIDYGHGTISPSQWGYKPPEKRKRRKG